MQIDHMRVAIRPMNTAQAVDLGFMMARHWFIPLWQIWIGMALPVFLLYLLAIFYDIGVEDSLHSADDVLTLSVYAMFIFWWLKPIYEKPMVTWLGSALFGEKPSTMSTIKKGWRTVFQYFFILMFRYRLSPSRQLILPILQLEAVNQQQYDKQKFNQRYRLLQRGQSGSVSWHTIIMLHIEGIINFGLIGLMTSLVPQEYLSFDTLMTYLEQSERWFEVLSAALYFLSASVVAPFFICGGFCVYLTKRCMLEGWDVELTFKQLVSRYQQAQSNPINQIKHHHSEGGLS